MERLLWNFYYEDEYGKRHYCATGLYKKPQRTKYWNALNLMFESGDIRAYGIERVYSQFDGCYFLYDKSNRQILRLERSGDIATFDNKLDAIADCRGNECVLNFYELPVKFQKEMVEQITKYE